MFTSESQQINRRFRGRHSGHTPSATPAGSTSGGVSSGSIVSRGSLVFDTAEEDLEDNNDSNNNTGGGSQANTDDDHHGCRDFTKHEVLQATNGWARQIASGGFGTVYAGKITTPLGDDGQEEEIDVAVKRYTYDRRDLLQHELHHIMSVPPHRHLIRAIGKCEEDTCVCIVLPLLTPLFNNGNFVPLTEQERLQVCCDVTEAVVYLHFVRRQHRDIKPHNILLDSQKRAVLTDLGVTEEVSTTTPRGGFSPSFAPPEWTDAPASKFSGDIFCLGLTIASIVALRAPANNTTDRQALIESLQPRSLKRLVRRMMDDNQARRPIVVDVLSRLRQLQGSAGAAAASSSSSDPDVASTTATATTQHHPLSSSKLDKYPPRFSCSAEVAIERVDALNKIRDAFANKNDDRLVLLYGPHGAGKTIAAAQYCKQRKQQQSDKKNIIAAQVQASTLRESLRDMFDIPIDSDKITFDDIRKTMDAIYDRLPVDDKNTRICLLVDDLSCTDEETVKNFVFLSKSKLIDGIVATVPTESTPNYYEDCQLVPMTTFSVDETIHLARNVLGGADADATSALLQQRGVDMDSAQALLDACGEKPFLIHRALEQFKRSFDHRLLADFIAKQLTPQTLESSPRSKYEHTLKSITALQIDAFRKHFKMSADAATPLELLLTACKKLQIQQFDMQFLRLVLHVDAGGSDNDIKLTEWVDWMKSNIGLVHNLADSTFKLHYLQSVETPLFDGAMDWEHAAVLSQLKESYDDALKLTTAWILSKSDDELRPRDQLTIAFCVVARTCGLFESNPTEAPAETALSLWHRLEAAWNADKPPQGKSAEIAARGAEALADYFWRDASKYRTAADVCAVALRFARDEAVRAKLVNVRGISLEDLGKREEGVALKKQALEMRLRIHRGADHLEVARSFFHLGISLFQMGKREEGVALQKQALEMFCRIRRGADDREVAASLTSVGQSLSQMGKREEGVTLLKEALEMRRRIYRGVDHPHLASSLIMVGFSLLEMAMLTSLGLLTSGFFSLFNTNAGTCEEGGALLKQGLEMLSRIHRGEDRADVAVSLIGVGVSLAQMDHKREEGVALQKQALEMLRRIYRGVDHPVMSAALLTVGASLDEMEMGKCEEGLALQGRALEMQRRIHDNVSHPAVAQSLCSIVALVGANSKRGEGGLVLMSEAVEMQRRIHRGADHPDVAQFLTKFGASLLNSNRHDEEGVALLKEGLQMYRRVDSSGQEEQMVLMEHLLMKYSASHDSLFERLLYSSFYSKRWFVRWVCWLLCHYFSVWLVVYVWVVLLIFVWIPRLFPPSSSSSKNNIGGTLVNAARQLQTLGILDLHSRKLLAAACVWVIVSVVLGAKISPAEAIRTFVLWMAFPQF